MSPKTLCATDYHRATSYRRHQLTPHTLDWAHQPAVAKRYPDLPRVTLDREVALPEIACVELGHRLQAAENRRSGPVNIQEIAAVLHLTHTVTARSTHSGQPFYYRSVASAGALYPFEIYLAVNQMGGLEPGVYHYDLFDFSLTALRQESMPVIPPAAHGVAASFYISGIFFRSAWKYRGRAYRYALLDAGHLLENLRLALRALDLCFSIHLDFNDEQAATLLGLDPEREVCLVCVHLHADTNGQNQLEKSSDSQPLADGIRRTSRVSDREVAYPEILAVHQAGNGADNYSGDARPVLEVIGRRPVSWIDLERPVHPPTADHAQVLWQRRSRRNFIPASVSRDCFMGFMDLMAGSMGNASDMPPVCISALTTGFLVGEKMPVAPGFYLLDPDKRRLGHVSDGRFMEPMAAACLDQMWLKHAGLHLLLMTDPAALDRSWGARGYRYAMIEAGRLGQQAYLAATASGWGACGIGAIYDREAADLLDLTADGVLLYLVGTGPVKTR